MRAVVCYDESVKRLVDPAVKRDQHYTYVDYRSWPEDERWELIDGVAWNMWAAPTSHHQTLLHEFGRQIGNLLDGHNCRVFPAPFDVLLPETADESWGNGHRPAAEPDGDLRPAEDSRTRL